MIHWKRRWGMLSIQRHRNSVWVFLMLGPIYADLQAALVAHDSHERRGWLAYGWRRGGSIRLEF
jgi:hypothetical protein